jgi:hypothetical protein
MKREAFHQRRKSNSALAFDRNPDHVDQLGDAYYRTLNEAHPQVGLTRDISANRAAQGDEEQNKMLSRHDLLYNSRQVYDERKQTIREELLKERTKPCTFQPKLYKSKVPPKKELNHQVY